MQDHFTTPNVRDESSRPWRAAPPKNSPWTSDLEIWESLDSESIHHVPEGVITPEMRAESIRDARPFWWARSANVAVALVEDVDRDDYFRIVQGDSLTKLVALLRNGVEWPDFVDVSEPLPWFEFEVHCEKALGTIRAVAAAASVLESHYFDADPMSGRWEYRLGKRSARIASLPLMSKVWVTIRDMGTTGELVGRTDQEIHDEITEILRK